MNNENKIQSSWTDYNYYLVIIIMNYILITLTKLFYRLFSIILVIATT